MTQLSWDLIPKHTVTKEVSFSVRKFLRKDPRGLKREFLDGIMAEGYFIEKEMLDHLDQLTCSIQAMAAQLHAQTREITLLRSQKGTLQWIILQKLAE